METKMMQKPQFMRGVLTVKYKEYSTPHYIRVVLEGADLKNFTEANVGDNNKILIPKDKTKKLELPEQKGGGRLNSDDFWVRTYTLRSLDLEKGEMAIDFVMHGETGPASSWAIHAEKGDELGVLMKAKSKPLFLPAEKYVLVGDHTAVPVISVLLEKLPEDAIGTVLLEVYSKEDMLPLTKPNGVTLNWLINSNPGTTTNILDAFATAVIDANTFVYAAAEFTVVKQLQEKLRKVSGLERKNWYAFSYWKYGKSEDASAKDRKELSHTE
ncbi:siderophore-interacting protein [Neptunitalea chrysea]|uniref:Siderophore-interacting protein n=1 Tax=Neptunitalea chrysea TaxID=1647581 RepID=A0A9W6B6A6_9FLAO|nr:siderophore-interacting protein [Neptunitalea chrysea]GLB53469.1 siderophore-interacting protein [Neptunitalea chrysea]